jgi:cyclic pyranopterin phosphate synthase
MTTNGALLTPEIALSLKRAGLRRVNISLDTLDWLKFRKITSGGCLQSVLAGIDAALAAGLTPVKINMVVFPETTQQEIRRMRAFCAEKGAVLQTIAKFSLKKRNGTPARLTDRPLPCENCNRLRLTADGFLLPCLFSDKEIHVDMQAIRDSYHRAVAIKPPCGISCRSREMHQIGG